MPSEFLPRGVCVWCVCGEFLSGCGHLVVIVGVCADDFFRGRPSLLWLLQLLLTKDLVLSFKLGTAPLKGP